MEQNILKPDKSLLLIVDIQEKFIPSQFYAEEFVKNSAVLAKTANILNIPTVVSEQYPKGLGATIDEIKSQLSPNVTYFEKNAFSCCAQEGFKELIASFGKEQIIICGIEAHVCMHQTVAGLLSWGYQVHLVKDAVSSRKLSDYEIGIERMLRDGAILSSTEMALFELMVNSKHPNFREIQSLIK